MTERVLHLMQREQLTPAEFAAKLGIDRTSISHFISGRNQPSRVFIEKMLSAFPTLNARWLILGEGEPYSAATSPPTLFEAAESVDTPVTFVKTNVTTTPATVPTPPVIQHEKKIEEIVVFNSDGTFNKFVERPHS
jgi:transcriptional regulator with XRE-family HTH domain